MDGQQVESCLTLPPDYKPGRRYPTIVHVYPDASPPCPEGMPPLSAGYANMGPLASQGYIILHVWNVGVRTDEGGPLTRIVEATDLAVDAAIEADYVDPDLLALIGSSGSGYGGLWIAAHSSRYKALISINGLANLLGPYFRSSIDNYFYPSLWPWNGNASRFESKDQFGLGKSPWQDQQLYWRSSPIAYASSINIPVLLIGTDMDSAGFSQEYDEMFVALHRLRKHVDYVKYFGEGHGPLSPANVRDLTRRTLEHLGRYVGRGQSETEVAGK